MLRSSFRVLKAFDLNKIHTSKINTPKSVDALINNPASKIPQASQMLRRLDEQNPLKIVQLSCQFNHF